MANFKSELKRLRPDVEFVSEHWPPLNKIDAGAVIQAVMGGKPDAIFNATFGSDLARLVREGTTRNAFAGRSVVSILTGEPESGAAKGGSARGLARHRLSLERNQDQRA